MAIIAGSKSFTCPLCEKQFSQKGNLKTHLRMHTGEKPFSCSQCDYKCNQLSTWKAHERIHTGDKPFSCSQCDYKCSRSFSLKQHERTHTGDKPYSCTKCGKSFKSVQTLRKHKSKCPIERSSSPGSFVQEIKTEPKWLSENPYWQKSIYLLKIAQYFISRGHGQLRWSQ